jgi:aryl-alcohol dehydrogenase-like predicted oxidoreductase
MRTVTIPQLGEAASVIGFGCWGLSGPATWTGGDDADGIAAVRRALDLGITFFDVAPRYGEGHAEEVLGRALGSRRDEVLIASKCGLTWEGGVDGRDLSPAAIRREIDDSLQRLGTDRVDVYQMHWPDPDTPVEESMEALLEIRDAGKIRAIGVSNFSIDETRRALAVGPLATHQGLFNLLEHNPVHYHGIPLEYRTREEVLPFVVEHDMVFLPYSPLMQGLLTDGYDPGEVGAADVRRANPRLFGPEAGPFAVVAARLRDFAAGLGRPLEQVALTWLTAQPGMGPVIAGAQTAGQVEALAAAGDWELIAADLTEIDRLLDPLSGAGLL